MKKSLLQNQWVQAALILIPFTGLLIAILASYLSNSDPALLDDKEIGEYIMKRSAQIRNMYRYHKRNKAKLAKKSIDDPELKSSFQRIDYDIERYYSRYIDELMDTREDYHDYKRNKLHMQLLYEMKDVADEIYEKIEELHDEERDLLSIVM